MDFTDTPEERTFRLELRSWLADHAPTVPEDPAARADAQNAWHQVMYEAGEGPVAWKVSARVIQSLTGRPVFFARTAATGSR